MTEFARKLPAIRRLMEAYGMNAKKEILKNDFAHDRELMDFLYLALNPMITYNLSEKTLTDMSDRGEWESTPLDPDQPQPGNILEECRYLASQRGLKAFDVRRVKAFLYYNCSGEERLIYISLLSGTLRLGVTAKTVNQVIPGLIPEWEVQQAYPIEKYPIPEGTEFWLTQKLNGVRATYHNGTIYARSGTPYTGLEHISSQISQKYGNSYVFDGELTLADKGNLSDNEAFRKATGIINSDSADKTSICYTIFDMVQTDHFERDGGLAGYGKRRMLMDAAASGFKPPVSILPVLYHGTDQSVIPELLDQMVSEDKEGLMLNTDCPYRRTRHRGILKIKRFYTMDLVIISSEEGTGRLAGTLGALELDYRGHSVMVGSGFTDEQRAELWARRLHLPGRICEVKYKEISYDKNTGIESLQFPTFVAVRTDKNTVSYD